MPAELQMGSEHPLPNGNAYDNVSTSEKWLIFNLKGYII